MLRGRARARRPYLARPEVAGDILFHGNSGEQCDAIREATGSPYTHCGAVIEK